MKKKYFIPLIVLSFALILSGCNNKAKVDWHSDSEKPETEEDLLVNDIESDLNTENDLTVNNEGNNEESALYELLDKNTDEKRKNELVKQNDDNIHETYRSKIDLSNSDIEEIKVIPKEKELSKTIAEFNKKYEYNIKNKDIIGKIYPNIKLVDKNGEKKAISDIGENKIIMHSSSTCGYCNNNKYIIQSYLLDEEPNLNIFSTYDYVESKELLINGYNFERLVDKEYKYIDEDYSGVGLPRTFILDKDNRIISYFVGQINYEKLKELENILK